MRDKLIHEYFGVDYETLWETIKKRTVEIKPAIEKMAKDLKKKNSFQWYKSLIKKGYSAMLRRGKSGTFRQRRIRQAMWRKNNQNLRWPYFWLAGVLFYMKGNTDR